MEKAPTVSVIMPVYNAERYLRPAIDSVLNQMFNDFELIIIEDASNDSTREIVAEYAERDPRVIAVVNDKNLGLTPSLNKGLDLARGEFIARMDADDISHPERFEKQVSYLRSNSDVCMIATSRERIDEEGNTISSYSETDGKEGLRERMKVTCSVAHGSVMFRRKEVIELGKYRDGIPYAEDYDLWLRIMEKYNIDVLPDILYKFRLTHQSRSIADSKQDKHYHKLVRQFAKEREIHGRDSYEEHAGEVIRVKTSPRHKEEMYHLHRGLEYLASNFQTKARGEFWKCAKHRPTRALYWLLIVISIMPLVVLGLMRKIWRRIRTDVT